MDELNTLAAELSSALSVFADLRVSASVILLALIVWLVWTASSHVRHRGAQLDSVEDDADPRHAASSPPAASPSDDLSSPKRQEGTAVPTMTQGSSVHTTAAALRERAGTVAATARDQVSATTQRWSEKAPRPQVAGVTVRRSRLALATLVALCALVFVVTGVAAAFGANTVAVAGWTLLGTVAGLGLLRGLALLDARARRREAERLRAEEAEAHRAPAHIARGARAATAGVHAEHQPAVLIDSADVARVRLTAPAVTAGSSVHDAAATVTSAVTASAAQQGAAQQGAAQRAAAEQGVARTVHGETADVETLDREKAAASIAAGRASSSEERAGAAAGMTTVPRPTYLDAPEMQRVITDTVTAPAKAPEGEVRLADGVSETHRARVRRAAQTNPNLDLDSVLARRRAS